MCIRDSPKSERGNWKETLPEIAHEINIVNLTRDKDNAGLLDPFVIMKNVKDAESLAIDILTFLTGTVSYTHLPPHQRHRQP